MERVRRMLEKEDGEEGVMEGVIWFWRNLALTAIVGSRVEDWCYRCHGADAALYTLTA